MTRLVNREWPEFDAMATFDAMQKALPDFVDTSWHNDSCPSLSLMNESGDDALIKIYVDFADVESREFGADVGQFGIVIYDESASVKVSLTAETMVDALALLQPYL